MSDTVFFSKDEDGDIQILDASGQYDRLATIGYCLYRAGLEIDAALGRPERKKRSRWKDVNLVEVTPIEIDPGSNVVPFRRPLVNA